MAALFLLTKANAGNFQRLSIFAAAAPTKQCLLSDRQWTILLAPSSTRRSQLCYDNVMTDCLPALSWSVRYPKLLHLQYKTPYQIGAIKWLEKKFVQPKQKMPVADAECMGTGTQTICHMAHYRQKVLLRPHLSVLLASNFQSKSVPWPAARMRRSQHKVQFGWKWPLFHLKVDTHPQPALQSTAMMKISFVACFWIAGLLTQP